MRRITTVSSSNNIKNEIVNILNSADDELSERYTIPLINLTKEFEINILKKVLLEILEDENIPKETMLAYNAFYTLTICTRRYRNLIEMKEYIDKYSGYFQQKASYNAIMCIYLTRLAENKKDYELFRQALEYAQKASDLMPNNIGVIHLFPDVVANCYLQGFEFDEDIFNKAIMLVKKCIILNSEFSTYYYTFGRLLMIENNYDEAEDNIKLAIQYENATDSSGLLRVSEYNIILLKIENQRLMQKSKDYFNLQIEETNKWRGAGI